MKKIYVLSIKILLVISLLNQVAFVNAAEEKSVFESNPYEEMILMCTRPLQSIRESGKLSEKLKDIILGNTAPMNDKGDRIEDKSFNPDTPEALEARILVHCTAMQVRKYYGKEGYEYRDSYAFGSDKNGAAVAYREFEILEDAVNNSRGMQCRPLIGGFDIPECRGLSGVDFLLCANPKVHDRWYRYEFCIDNEVVPKGYNFFDWNCCSGLRECGLQIETNSTLIDELYDLNAGAGREVNFQLGRFLPHGVARALDMSSTSSRASVAKVKQETKGWWAWIKSKFSKSSNSTNDKNL